MRGNDYLFDPNELAIEICRRHEMQVGLWPGELRESVTRKAFMDTIGKLPDFIEHRLITPIDGLYIMQIFMRYRSGNTTLSLIDGRHTVERIATKQEWELIQLLISSATNQSIGN